MRNEGEEEMVGEEGLGWAHTSKNPEGFFKSPNPLDCPLIFGF